jgi:hypothetical protein
MHSRIGPGHYVIDGHEVKRLGRSDGNRWSLFPSGVAASPWAMPLTTASNLRQVKAWLDRHPDL